MEAKHRPKLIAFECIDTQREDLGYLVHTEDLFAMNVISYTILTADFNFLEKVAVVYLPTPLHPKSPEEQVTKNIRFGISKVMEGESIADSLHFLASCWEQNLLLQASKPDTPWSSLLQYPVLAVKNLGTKHPIVYDKTGRNILESLEEQEHDLVHRMNVSGTVVDLKFLIKQLKRRS